MSDAPQAPPHRSRLRRLQRQCRLQRAQRWLIGRIYERNGFPDEVRFFCSLHGVVLTRPPSIHTDGFAPTLEEAKVRFPKELACKAWAGLEEVP